MHFPADQKGIVSWLKDNQITNDKNITLKQSCELIRFFWSKDSIKSIAAALNKRNPKQIWYLSLLGSPLPPMAVTDTEKNVEGI